MARSLRPTLFASRRLLLFAGGSVLAAPSIARAQAPNGLALVVGNSNYRWEAALPNVRRDALDIAQRFEAMGLRTTLIQEADRLTLLEAIKAFGASAKDRSFAAFYFAGHGAQPNNQVHLVPVDADLSIASAEPLVDTTLVRRACEGALAHMRVYDNCRNNPADGWRQRRAEDSSLVRANRRQGSRNTLGLFSTTSGRVALDGPPGKNSPFAEALMRQLASDSVDLFVLPSRLRRDVLLATRGRQVVVDDSTFQGPYALKGARGRPSASAPSRGGNVVELANAYAFAREKGILLPGGLVAVPPESNAPLLRQKVGAFKTTERTGAGVLPMIVAVLSAETEGDIQVILAGPQNGGWWRFVSGKMRGDRLEFNPFDSPQAPHLDFRWHTNDGGKVTTTFPALTASASVSTADFERLDG